MEKINKRVERCKKIIAILEQAKHKNGSYFTSGKKIIDLLEQKTSSIVKRSDGSTYNRYELSGSFTDWTCWDKSKNEKYFKLYVRNDSGVETREQFSVDMNNPVVCMIEKLKGTIEYETSSEKEAFSEEGKEKQVDEAKEMLLRVIDERLPKIQQFVKEFPKYQVEIDTLISLKKHIVSFSR